MRATAVDTDRQHRARRIAPSLVPSMLAAGIAVAAARWTFSSDRRVFHVSPDEASQVAVARWLAGGRWNMFDHATWQPGLGTLLTPVFWFTDDGTTVVRAALAVNALIAGLSAVVLVALTRRLTGLGPVPSAVAAVAVAVAPASLSASSFVWAEALVSLCFVGTVALLLRWFDSGRVATGVGALAVAVAGYTAHSRLLVLVGTTVVMTVGAAAWRRRWGDAAVLAVATVVLFGASAGWTRFLLANIWDDPSDQNTVGSVWERAQQPVEIADALLGQVWYQGAATLGTAFVGAAVLVRAAVVRRRVPELVPPDATPTTSAADDIAPDATVAPDPPATSEQPERLERLERLERSEPPEAPRLALPTAVDARVVLASVIPLVGLSAVFMSDRPRPDQFIYGRYNDAIVWPVITIGLAWLVRRTTEGFARRHLLVAGVVVAAIVGLGLAVDALHGDEIRERYGVRSMIAGLLPFVDGTDTLDVRRTSVVSAAIFVGAVIVVTIAGVRRLPRRVRLAAVAVGLVGGVTLLVVAGTRTEEVADLRLNGWERTNTVRVVDDLVPPGMALGVRPVPNSQDPVVEWVPQRQRFQLYQLWLPDRTFVRDRGVDDDVGPYVFAPLDDPALVEAGADLIWRDPGIRVGLWREPTVG